MEHSQTHTLERTGSRFVKYDLVGKVAEGTRLTRRSAARILSGIEPRTFDMFKHNPEEFIAKAVRLINEQKAMLLVENIAYHPAEGAYDSTVFTAKKNTDLSQAYRAKRNVQDYVITDGYAKDGRSIERRFAEDLDAANEVLVLSLIHI